MGVWLLVVVATAAVAARAATSPNEARRGSSETAAEPIPASQVDVLPIQRVRGLVGIPIEVSGSEPLNFVLDSGTPTSALNDVRLARELSLRARYMGRGQGFAGEEVAVLVAPDVSLRHDGVELLRTELAIHHVRPQLGEHGGAHLDGLLGGELFARFVVEIDSAAGVVRLHDPDRFRPPDGASRVRLKLQRGVPLVRARITNRDGKKLWADLLVDTGSETVVGLLSDSHPRLRAPEDGEEIRVLGVGGETTARVGTIQRIELGDVVLTQPEATFFVGESLPSEQRIPRLNGVLGAGFLLRYHAWIDYAHHQLLLAPRSQESGGQSATGVESPRRQ
jgi:hypothetical protein